MVDPGRPDATLDAEGINLACFRLTAALRDIELCVPEAAPLARLLLRAAGRIVIDTGGPGADPATWANTEEMVLLWLDEALKARGYQVRPLPGGGRAELAEPGDAWS